MSEPSVFKPTVTRPVPADAELFEQDGRPHARWRDGRGQARIAPVVVPDKGPAAGQRRIVLESDRYAVRYRDADGVVRTVNTELRDEGQALQMLEQILAQIRAARPAGTGQSGEQAAEQGPISFRDHFREYLQALRNREVGEGRLADIERQVRRVSRQCRFLRLSEVNGDAVRQWLTERTAEGMPTAVCNAHLDDLMDFVAWCLLEGRLKSDPLKSIKNLKDSSAEAAPAGGRRGLAEEELTRLLKIALWRPLAEFGRVVQESDGQSASGGARFVPVTVQTLEGLVFRGRQQLGSNPKQISRLQREGWQRALIYKVMALLGLRRSELVALRMGSLHLGVPKPYLRLGGSSRGGQGVKIPLRADLAGDLELWLQYRWRETLRAQADANRVALKQGFLHKPVFKLPAGLAKMLTIDLQAAGIMEQDANGVRIDVHAVREAPESVMERKGIPLAALRSSLRDTSTGSGIAYTLREGFLRAIGLEPKPKDQPAERP